jgi:hypothetical protein
MEKSAKCNGIPKGRLACALNIDKAESSSLYLTVGILYVRRKRFNAFCHEQEEMRA